MGTQGLYILGVVAFECEGGFQIISGGRGVILRHQETLFHKRIKTLKYIDLGGAFSFSVFCVALTFWHGLREAATRVPAQISKVE